MVELQTRYNKGVDYVHDNELSQHVYNELSTVKEYLDGIWEVCIRVNCLSPEPQEDSVTLEDWECHIEEILSDTTDFTETFGIKPMDTALREHNESEDSEARAAGSVVVPSVQRGVEDKTGDLASELDDIQLIEVKWT